MATLDGKFTYSNISQEDYINSFKGKTKTPARVKVGGTESDPYGFVIDAIDIDWGGLSVAYIDYNNQLQIAESEKLHNSNDENKDDGIKSSGHLLNLISESFSHLRNLCNTNTEEVENIKTYINAYSGNSVKDINIEYEPIGEFSENSYFGTLSMTINYL